jgi:hypothetical protein
VCGKVCPSGTSCIGGVCRCPSPQAYCPGIGCTNLQTDVYNCGSCGALCHYTRGCAPSVCANGICQSQWFYSTITCTDGEGDSTSYCTAVLTTNSTNATACIQNANIGCSVSTAVPGLCPG